MREGGGGGGGGGSLLYDDMKKTLFIVSRYIVPLCGSPFGIALCLGLKLYCRVSTFCLSFVTDLPDSFCTGTFNIESPGLTPASI